MAISFGNRPGFGGGLPGFGGYDFYGGGLGYQSGPSAGFGGQGGGAPDSGGGFSTSDWINLGGIALGFLGNLFQGWQQGKVTEAQLETAREQLGLSREQFEFMKEQTLRQQQVQQSNLDLIAPALQDYAGQVSERAMTPVQMPRPEMPMTGNPYQREPTERRPITLSPPPTLGPPPGQGPGGGMGGQPITDPGRPITEPSPFDPMNPPRVEMEGPDNSGNRRTARRSADESRNEQVAGMRPRLEFDEDEENDDPWSPRRLAFGAASYRR